MSMLKPIKLWGGGGPNPPKVAMLLAELDVPYEVISISFPDLKKPEFLAINPNGRMPAIYDPNTDITLWESGAILEYLVERYDTAHKLSFAPGTPEAAHARQWLFFQVSGQGPYFGQAVWFTKFHPEQLPSARERYVKEIARVTSVLEGVLAKQKADGAAGDGPWLVGNKFSYADLSFIMWQHLMGKLMSDAYNPDDYPHVKQWMDSMTSRKAIKSVIDGLDH